MELQLISSDSSIKKPSHNIGKEALITAGINTHRFGFNLKAIEQTGFKIGEKLSIAKDSKTGLLYLFKDEKKGRIIKKWDKITHTTISFSDSGIRNILNIDMNQKVIFKVLNSIKIGETTFFNLELIIKNAH